MARLMLGRSDSSCSFCSAPIVGEFGVGHFITRRVVKEKGKWVSKQVDACGQMWDGIQSSYFYGDNRMYDYFSKPGEHGFYYGDLLGLPCYDASGKFLCNYGSGLDVQLALDVDSSHE